MKLAIVTQDAVPASLAEIRRAIDAGAIERWMYVGEDAGWRIRAERTYLVGLARIALGERTERYSQQLRRPYIDWIGELSERNGSIEWWGSELAAKNPYTWHYSRLCALAAAREILSDPSGAGTLAVCSTAALAAEIQVCAEALGVGPIDVLTRGSAQRRARVIASALARTSLRRWAEAAPNSVRSLPTRLSSRLPRALDSTPGHRRQTLAELGAPAHDQLSRPGSVLLVSWVDERSFTSDGSYRDPHMGPLGGLLRARGLDVALLARVLPEAPFAATAARLLNTGERVLFPEQWISPADSRSCERAARRFSPRIPDAATVSGVPVTRLAREHVEEFRRAHAEALSFEPLIRNLAASGIRPERVIIPFEGHTWEQVLIAAVHAHLPGSRVVGRDNLANSRMILGLFPAQAEIGRRPLPDRVVTNGPVFRDVLVSEGFPEDAVRAGCALRHAYLWESPLGGTAREPRKGPRQVLVAGSIDVAQTLELIDVAVRGFGGDDAYLLDIKCHPAADARRLRSEMGDLDSHENVRFVETPIPELLETSDLVLYNYTVVGYEALAHGVAPVFVQAETFLDLDKLEPFPDVHWIVRSAEELRAAAAEIAALDDRERADWQRRARHAVLAALAPIDDACVEAYLA